MAVWGDACRETTIEFMEALPPVVDKIMSIFALGLGFPEDFFKKVTSPFLLFQ